uniref:Integral membrane protein GPR180 n=1 Tax=Hirondellea gigas TaxID=1518452 RepID=A0A6A7FTT8_9CRUS
MSMPVNSGSSVIFLLICCCIGCESLLLKGEWHSKNNKFLFLSKFGFQKTIPHEGVASEGFIFGNITALKNKKVPENRVGVGAMLVLLPRQYFLSFHGNMTQDRSKQLQGNICQKMFKDMWTEAYDAKCHDTGREDFLRHVPCPEGQHCLDEDNPSNVMPDSQLTYAIKDINNPRFWYLSLVACGLNATCGWQPTTEDISVSYHLTLVNGHPPATDHDFFAYHFSCEEQNTGELVVFCLLVYSCLLLPLQLYATCKQRLRVLELFACVLLLQTLGLVFTVTAQVVMGASGTWMGWAGVGGEVCTLLCESLFLGLLLLLARGWAITNTSDHFTATLYALWGTYTLLTLALYAWNKLMVPVVENTYKYGKWPGIIDLVLRGLLTVWYLFELRTTMLTLQDTNTLHFLLQFGAASLVWLVYLPVVALIAVQVSPLWRHKLLQGFRYSADLLAHVFMAYILYPRRSHPYLVLATPQDNCDELDFLDQAPHILHRRKRRGRRSSSSSSTGRRDSFGPGTFNRYTDLIDTSSQQHDPCNYNKAHAASCIPRCMDAASTENLVDEETVEFERVTKMSRETSAHYHNAGVIRADSIVNGSPSKYKVQVNRSNGFYAKQNYNPISRNILDATQQSSYTQLGPFLTAPPDSGTLSFVANSLNDKQNVASNATASNSEHLQHLTVDGPSLRLMKLEEEDIDGFVAPYIATERALVKEEGFPSYNSGGNNGFEDPLDQADYFSAEASDGSDTELLVVVQDQTNRVPDSL